jgi:hypothetical protein
VNDKPVETSHFQQLSKRRVSLESYFSSIRSNVLIVVDESAHQITLSFAFRPCGHAFRPIEHLCIYPSGWLLKQRTQTEYTFGFAQICDLGVIAQAISLEYRALGYRCSIRCGDEIFDVEQALAEAELTPWQPLAEVKTCA